MYLSCDCTSACWAGVPKMGPSRLPLTCSEPGMTWPLSSRSTTAQACRLPSDRRMGSKFYQRQHVSDGTDFFIFLFRLAQAGSAEDTRRDETKTYRCRWSIFECFGFSFLCGFLTFRHAVCDGHCTSGSRRCPVEWICQLLRALRCAIFQGLPATIRALISHCTHTHIFNVLV